MAPGTRQPRDVETPPLDQDAAEALPPLITMENVTLRKSNAFLFAGTSWRICDGQNWAILGPNGSGKSILARAVKGDVACVGGRILRHVPEAAAERIGYLSFELQEEILKHEDRLAESLFFSGDGAHAPTAARVLGFDGPDGQAADRFLAFMDIRPLLGRGLRVLSNGETRKVLIARALLKQPKILILDDPFAGLDRETRQALSLAVTDLMAGGTRILLVTPRIEEVIAGITHVLMVHKGRVARAGRIEAVLTPEARSAATLPPFPIPPAQSAPGSGDEILVEMKNVHVAYGNLTVLDRLNWIVRRGTHWAVVGPNGSGKTTLLGLITGENLQAYANEVLVFGRKRGAGQSLREIRDRIGLVSPELQLRYRRPVSVREAVLSGFFDSIGLYRKTGDAQERIASQWLACIGLHEMADRDFSRLSYGEKRLALVARAMVKSPELLILDEPCQGLDSANRKMVLALMEEIGRRTTTTMIYVTHHQSDMIPCIDHVLTLAMGGRVRLQTFAEAHHIIDHKPECVSSRSVAGQSVDRIPHCR